MYVSIKNDKNMLKIEQKKYRDLIPKIAKIKAKIATSGHSEHSIAMPLQTSSNSFTRL